MFAMILSHGHQLVDNPALLLPRRRNVPLPDRCQ
jgi:hypothetical protein